MDGERFTLAATLTHGMLVSCILVTKVHQQIIYNLNLVQQVQVLLVLYESTTMANGEQCVMMPSIDSLEMSVYLAEDGTIQWGGAVQTRKAARLEREEEEKSTCKARRRRNSPFSPARSSCPRALL
ncbi:hypothetical protein QZH41_001325 [Actinostola sp. cb2023]|nr:hypothetical protein QZH41_001325 [Actinostola sp. cb2023]